MKTCVFLLVLAAGALAVDRSKFRTCAQTGFCRRHRDVTEEPKWRVDNAKVQSSRMMAHLLGGPPGAPPMSMLVRALDSGAVRVKIVEDNGMEPRWEPSDILVDGGQRESENAKQSSSAPTGATRLEWTPKSADAGSAADRKHWVDVYHDPFHIYAWREGDTTPYLEINEKNLFYFEHRRPRDAAAAAAAAAAAGKAQTGSGRRARRIMDWGEDGKPVYADDGGEEEGGEEEVEDAEQEAEAEAAARKLAVEDKDCDACWAENFGSHADTKPNGPMSVGFDAVFPQARQLYGIPEHADGLPLRATKGSNSAGPNDAASEIGAGTAGATHDEPYRLYNLDVFEYELDVPMALYGSIPFLMGVGADGRVSGLFWHNPSETFVDIDKSQGAPVSRWMSESGVFDLTAVPGPDAASVMRQFTSLVGRQTLPPLFSLGYHQCRWNYRDEADVFAVDSKFEEHDFPYDVLWLDIEHTDGKRYFTWDTKLFPDPAGMQNRLATRGRKMVTIVDPHIKRDGGYAVHSEASSKQLYVQNKDGGEYDGWCWPGSSSYLDFTDSNVRRWWSERFKLENYGGSTEHLFTWNDMNEPSVFNGPEVSMPKDAKSIAGVEHREWHNLYGFYQQWATADGHEIRGSEMARLSGSPQRPFVLSRAFFAGSQRFGAIWTGDNAAEWSHLRIATPMLLSIGMSGLTFAGADVGGFFNNPDSELMERWYQAGVMQPFFRAHAHLDTKRREPWLFGDEVLARLRNTVRSRYELLPFWYTLFHDASVTGEPVIRPLWYRFGHEEANLNVDDAWTVGDDLLVRPVYAAGETSVPMPLPGVATGTVWIDTYTHELFRSSAPSAAAHIQPGNRLTLPAPIDRIPILQRGGSIIPRRQRPRRCSALMHNDPYTFVIAPDASGVAKGSLFLDDESTFAFRDQNAFQRRSLSFSASQKTGAGVIATYPATLTSTLSSGSPSFAAPQTVERIVLLGLDAAPTSVKLQIGTSTPVEIAFSFRPGSSGHVEGGSQRGEVASILTIRKPNAPVDKDWTITLE